MHLCPDCQEYCSCSHDTDVTMRAAPADCRHACGQEEARPQPQWPWEGEDAC